MLAIDKASRGLDLVRDPFRRARRKDRDAASAVESGSSRGGPLPDPHHLCLDFQARHGAGTRGY